MSGDDPYLFPVGSFEDNFNDNPMVRKHGKGPDGVRCKTCRHMTTSGGGFVRTYWKCSRRGISRSTATDHRLKWDACRLYEEETP